MSKKEAFESVAKFELNNIQYTALFNDTIRESDNFFDTVIIPYHYRNANLYGIDKKSLLREAVRITKNGGAVIIHGFLDFPAFDHPFFKIFLKQVKDIYAKVIFYTEEEFKKELVDAGAKKIDIVIDKGHLFGIGRN